jgi:BMFP domain-containing protein YqiC
MKTLEEQIAELQDRLNKLENNLTERSEEYEPCCVGDCDCGCEEPETETNEEKVILRRGEVLTEDDNGPEFDSAGFSEADREPEPEQIISFNREELITLAAKLMERALKAAKEAVADTEFDVDSLVSLELNTWSGNTIEVELDKDTIVDNICSEISDTIYLDNDSVEDELHDILVEIGKIKIS